MTIGGGVIQTSFDGTRITAELLGNRIPTRIFVLRRETNSPLEFC